MEPNDSLLDVPEELRNSYFGKSDKLIPKWVREAINQNRSRLQSNADTDSLINQEKLRLRKILDHFRKNKDRCIALDEEQFNSGQYMPAGMDAQRWKLLKGTDPKSRKSPNFFNWLANEYGFNHMEFGSARSPWTQGWRTSGCYRDILTPS